MATKGTAGQASDDDKFPLRRLFYAERCDNLIRSLQMVSSVLRREPAGGNDARDATALDLAERLPPEGLEAAFQRIDAMWATWTRPDIGIDRNQESIERHARLAVLAAVEEATRIIHLSKVVRALARSRASRTLDAEDEALVANGSDAAVAVQLLDGKPHLAWTMCGLVGYKLDEAASDGRAADAEPPQAAQLIPWLVGQNGYPDVVLKLTDEQAERLVGAWPKRAGRPRDGRLANWEVIRHVLIELGLGTIADLGKEWKAFRRREMGE